MSAQSNLVPVTNPDIVKAVTEQRLSASQVHQDQMMIWDLMKNVMEKDVDYGITPGAKKPSLYKPGSEKILSMFKLSVDPLVEELTTVRDSYDEYRVRVYVTVKEMATGRFIGKGMGERSSWEEKYKWRRAIGEEEFAYYQKFNPEFVRIKFSEEWVNRQKTGRILQEKQVRVPTADRMNTVLKMGKKSAQIDACLTATAASAIFTQDLEDTPEYLRDAVLENQDMNQEQGSGKQKPQRKSASAKDPKKDAKPRDPACLSDAQDRMLWGVSRSVKLTDDEVRAKLKAEFKDKDGKPLEHSSDMLRADFQRYLDSVDPDFKHHSKQNTPAQQQPRQERDDSDYV